MPKGGKREGAGRPPGVKNKRTAEMAAAVAAAAKQIAAAIPDAFAGDAHALLMAVYKNEAHEWPLRVDAAKAAIRFEKPALNAVEHGGKDGGSIEIRIVKGASDILED